MQTMPMAKNKPEWSLKYNITNKKNKKEKKK